MAADNFRRSVAAGYIEVNGVRIDIGDPKTFRISACEQLECGHAIGPISIVESGFRPARWRICRECAFQARLVRP